MWQRLAFSTWNFFGTSANETHVHDIAAALERTGLKALGFDTVNIDAGSVDRDASTGELVPSYHFPSGLRNLSDFLHGAGFKFGAYNDISGHTCGNGPAAGSLGHYEADAHTWAVDWQIDYLKIDFCGVEMPGTPPENCTGVVGRSCGTVPVEPAAQYAHWSALSTAVNKTGRPIYLDFCPHAIADGVGTEVPKGKLMCTPPRLRTVAVGLGLTLRWRRSRSLPSCDRRAAKGLDAGAAAGAEPLVARRVRQHCRRVGP